MSEDNNFFTLFVCIACRMVRAAEVAGEVVAAAAAATKLPEFLEDIGDADLRERMLEHYHAATHKKDVLNPVQSAYVRMFAKE